MVNLKVLGLITARGGSKGIPRKNIRPLRGKPLLAYSIESAQQSRKLAAFAVSTEDQEIAEVAAKYGAPVPFMRPDELASDTATSISVVKHAIGWYQEHGQEFDAVMILQPTSPLRSGEDIDASIGIMEEVGCDSVMGMVEMVNFSFKKLKTIAPDGRILPFAEAEGPLSEMRQDLPHVYSRNGAIFLTKTKWLLKDNLFGEDSRAYLMPQERSIDINTPFDFTLTEGLIRLAEESKAA